MSSRISPLVFESRLPVGSSAKTIVGRLTSARPIATRCCCPPESSEGRWPLRSSRPIFPISSATHSLSGFSPASESGRTTFSSAFSIGSRLKNWKMNPMWLAPKRASAACRSAPRWLVPAIVTSPEVGLSRPARMCISVDLPEPDGPITAVSWPFAHIERDAPESIHRGLAVAVASGQVLGGNDELALGGGGLCVLDLDCWDGNGCWHDQLLRSSVGWKRAVTGSGPRSLGLQWCARRRTAATARAQPVRMPHRRSTRARGLPSRHDPIVGCVTERALVASERGERDAALLRLVPVLEHVAIHRVEHRASLGALTSGRHPGPNPD